MKTETVKLRMAKASREEWKAVMDFVHKLEDEIKHPEMSDEELGKWARQSPCLFRVVAGYQMLVDNCCDPDSDFLEFNSEINAALTAHRTKTGTKLVGRELKSLTPEELEELLALAGINIPDIDEPDPRDISLKQGEIRLHPKYNIIFQPSDRIDSTESIAVTVWRGEAGDCEPDTCQVEIRAGEVIDYWGGQNNATAVLKWFLDHGWKWIPQEEKAT